MADNGHRQAKRAVKLLDRFDETVVALLIGVNILHVVAAASATVMFVDLMGPGGAGVATVVMTLFIFIFAETIPKSIANINSDAFILNCAGVILLFSRLFRPLVLILTGTGEFFKKVFRVKENAPSLTEDEFATIVENVQNDGLLEENETDIIMSSIDFSDVPAAHVMTPREQVASIDANMPEAELKELLLRHRFSRFPVYEGEQDHIIGVLVAGKALYMLAKGQTVRIREIMEPPLMLQNTISAAEVFKEMRSHRTHFAVMRNGRGQIQGVITMDDVLEELVDDIGLIREKDPEIAKEVQGHA